MYFDTKPPSNQMVIIRTALIGGVSLILMLFLSVKSVVPMIEKDLLDKVPAQLLENQLDNIIVSVQGQDIYLEGLVNEETRSSALKIAAEVDGVRKVHDLFIISTDNAQEKNN